MSTSFLKATTSFCLALALAQPFPGVAWGQSPAPDCVPGTKDCPIVPLKNQGKKVRETAPQNNPQGRSQTNDRVAPQPRNQAQPPAQNQAQPKIGQPPAATGQQNRVQPQTNDRTAPQIRNRAQPPAQNQAQPRIGQPPAATGQQNRVQPQVNVPPPAPRALPLAARTPSGSFTADGRATSVQIAPNDVRSSRENRFIPRRGEGLTDLEKFGLILLGAAVVGAILSDGQMVVMNSGDRVVARDRRGRYHVYHDDNVLLRRPGSRITTERFHDGSLLTRILYPSGIIIFTVSAYDGRVLRRWVQYPHRPTVILFDDTQILPPPIIAQLPQRSPVQVIYTGETGPELVRAALMAHPLQPIGRFFNLDQIRNIPEVRYLVPEIEIASLNFSSGSASVSPDQAQTLAVLARVMTDMISRNPAEVFLVEGHSDAVGDPAMNMALSDARAEAAAAALTEYFGVPPQNMITQGYGETDLKEQTPGPSEANRHVIVRRITELLPPTGD